MTFRWLDPAALVALHDQQLEEHGGLPGIRDRNALESAVARPRQQAAYRDPDLAELAAAYACGLARNHSFTDGNKRIAWIAANLFLGINGYVLQFDPAEIVPLVQSVAEGLMLEAALAAWIRGRIAPISK